MSIRDIQLYVVTSINIDLNIKVKNNDSEMFKMKYKSYWSELIRSVKHNCSNGEEMEAVTRSRWLLW